MTQWGDGLVQCAFSEAGKKYTSGESRAPFIVGPIVSTLQSKLWKTMVLTSSWGVVISETVGEGCIRQRCDFDTRN